MAGNIVLDELQQDIGHVLAPDCRGRLEGVVQINFDIDVQAFNLLFGYGSHLPVRASRPPKVRIYAYKYGWLCFSGALLRTVLLAGGHQCQEGKIDP